jgi:hypothetical protein
MILEEMYGKLDILTSFRDGLTYKGHSCKTLAWINGQIELLNDLIQRESNDVMSELIKKTNYRLYKQIDKGMRNLVYVIKNPNIYTLCKLENAKDEWLNEHALIFSTERYMLVFTNKSSYKGEKYINNKWQEYR